MEVINLPSKAECLIAVDEKGVVIGDYWENLRRFELTRSGELATKKQTSTATENETAATGSKSKITPLDPPRGYRFRFGRRKNNMGGKHG